MALTVLIVTCMFGNQLCSISPFIYETSFFEQSWTSIRCQELLSDYIFVTSLHIWQFSLYCMVSTIWTFRQVIRRLRHRTLSGVVGEFVAWCHLSELFAQSFVDFDIGLCLGSSASSLLVSLFRTVCAVRLCQRRHRILSGVVGVFIAGVAILNLSLNNC